MPESRLERRDFLQLLALATAALAQACDAGPSTGLDAGGDAGTDAAVDAGPTLPPGLPHLGGAPDGHQGRVIAAFVDTVVPGRHRDPTGAPGGIDVGVPGMFFDPALPAAPLVGLLVVLLDSVTSGVVPHRKFDEVDAAARDQVLVQALSTVEQMQFAVQLAQLAFFSTEEAARHLGYPGANPGYWRDDDFSFRRPMCREITPDGNYR